LSVVGLERSFFGLPFLFDKKHQWIADGTFAWRHLQRLSAFEDISSLFLRGPFFDHFIAGGIV